MPQADCQLALGILINFWFIVPFLVLIHCVLLIKCSKYFELITFIKNSCAWQLLRHNSVMPVTNKMKYLKILIAILSLSFLSFSTIENSSKLYTTACQETFHFFPQF